MNVKGKWASYTIAILVTGLALQLLGSYAVGLWGARIGASMWLTGSVTSQIDLLDDAEMRGMQLAGEVLAKSDALAPAQRQGATAMQALLDDRLPVADTGRFWAWIPADDTMVSTSDARCITALADFAEGMDARVLRCDGVDVLVRPVPSRPELVVGFALDDRYAARLHTLTNAETAVLVGDTAIATTLTGDAEPGALEDAVADLPPAQAEGALFGERDLSLDGYPGFNIGVMEPMPVPSGSTWYIGARRFAEQDVTIALLVPASYMSLGAFYNTLFVIPISLLLAALIAVLVLRLVSRFSNPISSLQKSAHAVSEGNLDQSVPVPDAVEMREFCETYNAMLERLRETMDLRQQLAREVGRSEVATGVLHNVGNVLNGINVSVGLAVEVLRDSRTANLRKAVGMLLEHADHLDAFVRDDARGQKLLPYLDKLAMQMVGEREKLLAELQNLTTGVDHVKNVVRTQQAYAKAGGLTERCRLDELVDDAVRLEAASLESHGIEVVRAVSSDCVWVDKHKTLQILVNLLTNAKQAIGQVGRAGGRITVCSAVEGGTARIEVQDDGVGIPEENLGKIFSYGFTTSRDGHGFGLHNSANAANEMGGSLRCRSEGTGRGATFTLEVPVAERRDEAA